MYRDIPDELRAHMEPIIDEHACELVDLETVGGKGTTILRVIVDSKDGDGRVHIDVLARVSREIEAQLDAADAVAGMYRLEVSSPGLDRVLAREKDFEAARGSQVNLTTRRPLDGRRRFKGTLIDLKEGMIRLEIDGQNLNVPFEAVAKANKIYQFSSADFGSSDPEKRAE
jgi:ribosome maturation factor RimP